MEKDLVEIVVVGPAGSGKSSLVCRLAQRAISEAKKVEEELRIKTQDGTRLHVRDTGDEWQPHVEKVEDGVFLFCFCCFCVLPLHASLSIQATFTYLGARGGSFAAFVCFRPLYGIFLIMLLLRH
jgi:GTPase SAR1 family protein